MTHICVGKQTIIVSDNGLWPGRCQAIICTNAGMLLIGPLGTNFSEILIEILTFSFTKMRLKVSSAKWRPFCLGLNVFSHYPNQWLLTGSWGINLVIGYHYCYRYCHCRRHHRLQHHRHHHDYCCYRYNIHHHNHAKWHVIFLVCSQHCACQYTCNPSNMIPTTTRCCCTQHTCMLLSRLAHATL